MQSSNMEKFMKKCEDRNNNNGMPSKLNIDTNLVIPEFSTFTDIIECKICTGIVIDPVCCKFCDNIFCRICIADWLKRRKNECPFRCQFQEFQIRPTTKNMIHKIKLFCLNREKGCKDVLDYENYLKHLNNCEYFFYECIGCNIKGKKSEIKTHVLKCERLFKNCDFCCEKFLMDEINSHYEKCQMFEIPCKYCQNKIKRYNYEKHINSECQEAQVFCEYCEASFRRKYEKDHTKKICFDLFYKNLLKNNNNVQLRDENNRLRKEIEQKDQLIMDLRSKIERVQGRSSCNINNSGNNFMDDIGKQFSNASNTFNNIFKGKK